MNTPRSASAFATAALLALTSIACDSGSPDDEADVRRGVVVANQGNFSDGNGSVVVYDATDESTTTIVDGLGSIVQSVSIRGDTMLVASNTGNRIEVVDLVGGGRVGQVTDVTSPRYFAHHAGRTFVTNLFDNTVTVFSDEGLGTDKQVIPVGSNPEGMVVMGDRLYVANHGFGAGRTVTEIELASLQPVAEHDVGCDGPRGVASDAQNQLVVICTGQIIYDDQFIPVGETPGSIRIIDRTDGSLLDATQMAFRLGSSGPGQDFYAVADRNELYVVTQTGSVLRYDTQARSVVETLGPFGGDPIGAVAYDSSTDLLYLGRVPSFTAAGSVTILDRSGGVVGSFTAGVAPTFIDFWVEGS